MASQIHTVKNKYTPEQNLRLTQNWMSRLWLSQPKLDSGIRMSTHMHYGEQTKHVVWTLPSSLEEIELVHITDVQFGHIFCKVNRVIEYRDWVLSSPNRYMLWGGDMVDAFALCKSPGSPW